MTHPAFAALGLLVAHAMLEEAQEIEGWAWATAPNHTSLEDATAATEQRMKAQHTLNLARAECGLNPQEG